MNPLYTQLMDSKSAPRVAPKANTTQLGTAPMNLRSAMQKYAKGGDVEKTENAKETSKTLTPYNYNVGKNAKLSYIPGVGKVTTYWDEPNKRIIVSDEGYWNPNSPTGERLAKAVQWAHDQGYQAGVVASPFASERFGDTTTAGGIKRKMPGATDQQFRDYIDAADFVAVDPYAVHQASATPEILNNFSSFVKNVGDYAKQQGKDSWLVLQGFSPNDVDQSTISDYNNRLIRENAGRYNDLSYFNTTDVGNETNPDETPEGLGVQMDTTKFDQYATQAAQPFKMAEKTGLDLPADWNSYGAKDKIDWFNQNNIDSNTLAQSGVAQGDIDWMMQNSYTGNTAQQPQRMMAQAQPQEMTGIAALGGEQGYTGYQTGDSGIPGDEMNVINPVQTRPVQTDYGNDPRNPVPQTGGYDQPPPAQQQTDDYLNQFNNLMQSQVTPAAPDYSRSYAALGGADSVNSLRNQFLQSGLDENTIGSIFSQYYAPEQIAPAQQPDQQMARGGMAQNDIEQYLTRLGMVRK